MEAWDGSRREASMSAKVGVVDCIVGGAGGGMDVEDEARASQAAFSSSRLKNVSEIASYGGVSRSLAVPFDFFVHLL